MKKFFLLILLSISLVFADGLRYSVPENELPTKNYNLLKSLQGEILNASYNSEFNSIHRVLCRIPLEKVSKESSLDQDIKSFISRNSEVFNSINVLDLKTIQSKKIGRKYIQIYQQYFRDIPIYGSRVDFRISGNTISSFGCDAWKTDNSINTIPFISVEDARLTASGLLKFDNVDSSSLVLAPCSGSLKLAYLLSTKTYYPVKRYQILVDAVSGSIIDYYDAVVFNTSGIVSGRIVPHTPAEGSEIVPFPHIIVYCDLGYVDTTDEMGRFGFDGSASIINIYLEGDYATVTDFDGTRGDYTGFVSSEIFNAELDTLSFTIQELFEIKTGNDRQCFHYH